MAPHRPALLRAALGAAERGWRVFPLVPGRKRPRRAATNWEQRATLDPERIQRWWAAHPADNIGIATGPSGLVVIDVDVPKTGERPPAGWEGATGGLDVLEILARRHSQPIAATYTVTTPRGGRHLYYLAPTGGEVLRNTQGDSANGVGWKIDSRARGGYVVAAGSLVGRRRYTVLDDRQPVGLSEWLRELLAPPARPPAAAVGANSGQARWGSYAHAALEGEVRRVLGAPAGTRNWALNTAAWNLGRLVAADLLARQVVEEALCAAGVAAGYRDGPRAVAAVVRCALDARLRRGTS